jgi:hypothetical protein
LKKEGTIGKKMEEKELRTKKVGGQRKLEDKEVGGQRSWRRKKLEDKEDGGERRWRRKKMEEKEDGGERRWRGKKMERGGILLKGTTFVVSGHDFLFFFVAALTCTISCDIITAFGG